MRMVWPELSLLAFVPRNVKETCGIYFMYPSIANKQELTIHDFWMNLSYRVMLQPAVSEDGIRQKLRSWGVEAFVRMQVYSILKDKAIRTNVSTPHERNFVKDRWPSAATPRYNTILRNKFPVLLPGFSSRQSTLQTPQPQKRDDFPGLPSF